MPDASVVHEGLTVLVFVVLIALWLLPAWLVARYAQRKGYSFALFLIAGLIWSWLLALIVALLLREKRRTPRHSRPT